MQSDNVAQVSGGPDPLRFVRAAGLGCSKVGHVFRGASRPAPSMLDEIRSMRFEGYDELVERCRVSDRLRHLGSSSCAPDRLLRLREMRRWCALQSCQYRCCSA